MEGIEGIRPKSFDFIKSNVESVNDMKYNDDVDKNETNSAIDDKVELNPWTQFYKEFYNNDVRNYEKLSSEELGGGGGSKGGRYRP
jgi:sulfatase maturation enzyme AslB (radical SAM superfamily)